jgi:hypothetical protein
MEDSTIVLIIGFFIIGLITATLSAPLELGTYN